MKSVPNGHGFDPRPVRIEDLQDPARAEEALAHWDELDPSLLAAIEGHPQHGPRLAMLRKADRWLETRMGAAGSDACPSAEELYDYGRGPGYGPLTSVRRAQIERHLIRCGECEACVETLAVPPPVPLDSPMGLPGWNRVPAPIRPVRPSPSPILQESGFKRRMRALPQLVPLAVAAALVLALGIWIAIIPSSSAPRGFPRDPLLRGSSGGPLYFPRERVLSAGPAVVETFPALGSELWFELEPQADATAYSIDVASHGGDAFAVEEAVVVKMAGDSPTLRTARKFEPGSYTWTARAEVRGLPRELGARDFAVVADPELERLLLGLLDLAEPARSLEAVRILHERGYLADARAVARAMPASADRDAYLGQVPGR